MIALHTGGARQHAEGKRHRHELRFDAHLQILVGEGLLHAVETTFVGEFVMLVICQSRPEADGVDIGRADVELALPGDASLTHLDAVSVAVGSTPGIR